MDYTKLADALVARGIGCRCSEWEDYYWVPDGYEGDEPVSAEWFCHDWRVAGACMEIMCEGGSIPFLGRHTTDTYQCTYRKGWGHNTDLFHGVNESLPIAIILACLEATDET